jgi:D-sedoheptulose 7-phosphate isomerase
VSEVYGELRETNDVLGEIHAELSESRDVLGRAMADARLLHTIADVARLSSSRLKAGSKIFFAGNGGSAADAQHLAGELVSRFKYDRPGLAGIALTTDTSVLTAIGNDYGYERLFARQLEALGRTGDVLFAISTSGRSPNVVAALKTARSLGIHTVGLTGASAGSMPEFCDWLMKAPSDETPKIQEIHIIIGHTICALVEAFCYPR